jgi:hypothetical protein
MNRCAWALIGLVALVAALPTVIARTGLRHQLPTLARPGAPDGISIGEADLSWFSPVVLRNLQIPDLQGKPLLMVREIRTDRPLWELATNPGDVGRITISDPDCRITARTQGTNLGEVLARLHSTPARRSRPRLRLELRGGKVSVVDEAGAALLACDSIGVLFDDLRHDERPVTVEVTAATIAPSRSGQLRLLGAWTPPVAKSDIIGPGTVQLEIERWPLDPLLPMAREPLHLSALAGEATLRIDSRWSRLGSDGGDAELTLLLAQLEAAMQPADPQQPLRTVQYQNLQSRLRGTYSGPDDRLNLANSTFETPWFTGTAHGFISDLRGRLLCDVAGDVLVHLDAAREQLPEPLRSEVRLDGLETRRISIRGPLRPDPGANEPPLVVEAAIVWKLLEAFGVSSPDAEVQVGWNGQRLATNPVRVPLSGGRIAAVPTVEPTETETRLHFAGGPIIERAAFSEKMCRGWMRYLSPLMANTTSIDGSFSLAVDASTVAVEQWPQTELQGTLSIHAARVGPGPLTQQILGIVQQVRGIAERRAAGNGDQAIGWLDVSEQNVPFVIHAGRVEHRDLKLTVGPVVLESQGSVGLVDDTLDLLLVIRFPESWFADRPLLAGLRGDGLRIPILGTLTQPRIEAQPLRDFGRGIGAQAVDGLFRRLLDRPE